MPPNGWIVWEKSRARAIILEDLETGVLPVDASKMSATEAWEVCYSHMTEFVEVVFSQFDAQLRDHRWRMRDKASRSARESDALAHDTVDCFF
jgi:hypothetical protein